MPPPRLHIGLDAGGTKTALWARLEGQEALFKLKGPAANLQRQGLVATANVLVSLIQQILEGHPQGVLTSVCAGIAGAGRPEDQRLLASEIIKQLAHLSTFSLTITHDGAIALEGAFEGKSGLLLIAGTGSSLFARTRAGQDVRAGGWGYLLGDEGSGYQIGLQGLRAVAHAYDGGPPTHLRPLLSEQFGLLNPGQLIQAIYRDSWPIPQMAPLVLKAAEQGDGIAQDILRSQTKALATQAGWLANTYPDIAPRIALVGGLTHAAYYKRMLTEALTETLPAWSLHPPLHPPVMGALRLAEAKTNAVMLKVKQRDA